MKRIVLIFVLSITLICIGGAAEARAATNLRRVSVAPVRFERVEQTVTCAGTVTAGNAQSFALPKPALVLEVMVSEGDSVHEGDALFSCVPLSAPAEGSAEEFIREVFRDGELLAAALRGELAAGVFGSVDAELALETFSDGERLTLYAPCDGRVESLRVKEGGLALPLFSCVTINGGGGLEILAEVPEKELYRLFLGQEAKVTVRGANEKLRATVTALPTSVSAELGGLTGAEPVGKARLSLSGESESLPGMSCTVKILCEVEEKAMTVPYEVLREDEEGWFIYTSDGRRVEKTRVTYQMDVGDRVWIETEDGSPFYYLTDTEAEPIPGEYVVCELTEEK